NPPGEEQDTPYTGQGQVRACEDVEGPQPGRRPTRQGRSRVRRGEADVGSGTWNPDRAPVGRRSPVVARRAGPRLRASGADHLRRGGAAHHGQGDTDESPEQWARHGTPGKTIQDCPASGVIEDRWRGCHATPRDLTCSESGAAAA